MDVSPHIAIVDDDDAIRYALSSLLRSEDFSVSLFDSAEAFLQSLANQLPQCLLTDIQLPGLSGLDLQFRMRAEQPLLPVLVMTAFPEDKLRDQALAAGAVCFLRKPFDNCALLGCLRRAIAGTN
ncbi:response regulator transcription factor [Paracoccus aestuariivivens]|uniref:Response regulator n=1 Tax=Paracoccus aestuariivivens TaxID=1820333 RepID=A0A6L6J8V5_9RHOB|nr:response regulator [Paracoccus aestuariivivens]MTH77926.1 response regulator [Paracoccus aestuariivivens]